jgi:hypothetical protein
VTVGAVVMVVIVAVRVLMVVGVRMLLSALDRLRPLHQPEMPVRASMRVAVDGVSMPVKRSTRATHPVDILADITPAREPEPRGYS